MILTCIHLRYFFCTCSTFFSSYINTISLCTCSVHIFWLYMSEKNIFTHDENIFLCTYLCNKSCTVHEYHIYILNMSFLFHLQHLFTLHMQENRRKMIQNLAPKNLNFLFVNQFLQSHIRNLLPKRRKRELNPCFYFLMQMAVCILFRLSETMRGQILVCWRFSLTTNQRDYKVRQWKRGN